MKTLKQVVYVVVAILVFNLVRWGVSAIQTKQVNSNLTSFFQDESWPTFNSTEGKFRVNFPKYPSTDPSKTEKFDGITYVSTSYSADSKDGDNYNVVYGYYPETLSKNYNVKNGLEGSINGMVASDKSNELVSSNYINVGKYQGVDYVINNKNESLYLMGRVIIVSEGSNPVKIYVMMVVSRNKDITDNYTKFINSFEII